MKDKVCTLSKDTAAISSFPLRHLHTTTIGIQTSLGLFSLRFIRQALAYPLHSVFIVAPAAYTNS